MAKPDHNHTSPVSQRILSGSRGQRRADQTTGRLARWHTPREETAHGWLSSSDPARPGAGGFSMVELLAVLCVLAILGAAVAPSLLRALEAESKRREAQALSSISRGLREYVLQARQVPALAVLAGHVAQILGWPIQSVQTNAFGQARLFLYDPDLRIGSTTASTLPYTQGTLGASNVAGARFMAISSLNSPLPAILTQPGTNAAAVFAGIWEAPDETAPAGWTWGGKWDDIKIQRLNLAPLFTQVVLNNETAQMGRYSIDGTNTHVALPSNPFAAHFIARTALGLHDHLGGLQAIQVVPDVTAGTNNLAYAFAPSYVYELGIWRGRLFMGIPPPSRSGQDLQAAYEIFISVPPNVYKVGGVNQSSLTWSMYLFMSNYVVWANSGFSAGARSAVVASQSSLSSQLSTYCNKKAHAP